MALTPHTIGRLGLYNGSTNTTIAVLGASIDYSLVSSYQNHSGLLHATGLVRTGAGIPIIRATCYIQDAYDLLGLGETVLTAGQWELELAQTSAATVDSGSTHTHLTGATGTETLAYIDSWRVDEGSAATCEVVLMPFASNGSTEPISSTGSQALTALTTIPTIHGYGPLTINNTAVDGVKSISYSSGMQVTPAGHHDGLPYITSGTRAGMQPSIMVEHDDPVTLLGTLNSLGVVIGGTTKVRILKAAAGGPLGTSGALDFTIAIGHIAPQPASGQHGDMFRGGVMIQAVSSNGSTHPVAVATV